MIKYNEYKEDLVSRDKTMLWIFTKNNAIQLHKKLNKIDNKQYELYIKEKTYNGLTITFLGPAGELLEIDTSTLNINSNNIKLATIKKFLPMIENRLEKTNRMINYITT